MASEVMSGEVIPFVRAGDTRLSPRIEASGSLGVAFTPTGPLVPIRDINRGGFSIHTTESFKPGSLFDVWFTTETGLRIALMARAVHVQVKRGPFSLPVEGIAGFAFMQLQLPATRKKVDQLLNVVSLAPPVERPVA
jgi:hypothetical protein